MARHDPAWLKPGFEAYREFVNPRVAERTDLSGEPARVVRTEGGRLVLPDGHVIEDFHGTQAFGHRHPAIAAAVREFLDSTAPNWFPARVNPYAGRLAERLAARSGGAYPRAFFASSGSEAVEAAIKLARAVTRRPRVLALDEAYHGCTMGACGLMSPGPYRDPFGPHLPGFAHLPFGDAGALEAALAPRDVAAVVVEPIQVEGGVRPLPRPYIEALCGATEATGTLLVADEVQTGVGRTGQFLASQTWPRRPDAVCLGKHLGGGLVPISAMLTRADLFETAYGRNFESSEAHNCTFSGSAVACVAAEAALDLLTDGLMERVRTVGDRFRAGIDAALKGLPLFHEVRGEGLVVGVSLRAADHPWLTFEHFGMEDLGHQPTVGLLLDRKLYARGFFGFVCGHDWSVLRLQPRFTIEEGVLEEYTAALREELSLLCELV